MGDQTSTGCPNAGAAYIFTRSAGAWSQQAYVKASNTVMVWPEMPAKQLSCTKACDGEVMLGCSNLGVIYANGTGVTQDIARAIDLFQKSCDGGVPLGV